MHNTKENGAPRHAKNQSNSDKPAKNLEVSESLDADLISPVVREDDNARKGAPADASKLAPRGGIASRTQPTPMSPGGSANQRVGPSGGK